MNDEMKAGYDRAKQLAKEIWFDDNETEDASNRYYFNCGFAAGLKFQEEQQNYTIQSLKDEIKTQRKEIGALREERRFLLDQDKPPMLNKELGLE